MKPDRLTVTAQIKRKVGSDEYDQLIALHKSGEKIKGLIDHFVWMPFIVESVIEEGVTATFNLRMVAK